MENFTKSRLIKTLLNIEYEVVHNNAEAFAQEFNKLTQSDEDPIGEWLRLTRAKKGNLESDNVVILELLVEIYRKIESLEARISGETKNYVELKNKGSVGTIGHSCFALTDSKLSENTLYYGRIELPTFPTRIVPVYFIYHSGLAWIERIHGRDEAEWDGYVASKERALIRSIRNKKVENG
ncbi:hypothetical protein [Helicobacter turcicus]|uniref:Uncharacterized protein n=1 Tax=Helicobacter turcicus TaxID=2867412 RepID=A0ABS7JPT1_9HELI|nr:hypothetical protein [Helicobacter turcicus]MBX7491398.1 hypothetical protein [Helicobacter turcicus]MBX7546265.1 hypothetical protein [Helicobacter turcicus]